MAINPPELGGADPIYWTLETRAQLSARRLQVRFGYMLAVQQPLIDEDHRLLRPDAEDYSSAFADLYMYGNADETDRVVACNAMNYAILVAKNLPGEGPGFDVEDPYPEDPRHDYHLFHRAVLPTVDPYLRAESASKNLIDWYLKRSDLCSRQVELVRYMIARMLLHIDSVEEQKFMEQHQLPAFQKEIDNWWQYINDIAS